MTESVGSYICLRFTCSDEHQELLMAALLDFPMEGFEQRDKELFAFISEEDWTGRFDEPIRGTMSQMGYQFSITRVRQENWNKKWESSIEPIQAGGFFIHPSWRERAPEESGLINIEIDPKMSFGTGHHESTRLSLLHLTSETDPLESVLDIGTGTGILSIAAVFKGASNVLAVDNDVWSTVNTVENVDRNGVADQIEVRLGSLEVVGEGPYDLILANINREILLSMLPRFRKLLRPGGRLIMAGLLNSDETGVMAALSTHAFRVLEINSEGAWWSVKAEQAG